MAQEIDVEGRKFLFDANDVAGRPPGKLATVAVVGDSAGRIGEVHSLRGADGSISTSTHPEREPRDDARALLEKIADRWRATKLRRVHDPAGGEYFERTCMICGSFARVPVTRPKTVTIEPCENGHQLEFDVRDQQATPAVVTNTKRGW